jgi:hypothetical protein
MKKTEKKITNDFVNFDDFSFQKKIVTLNNKELPLQIGDKLRFSENDKYEKTVVGIIIHEDNRIQYMLEWYSQENGQFNTESVSLTELKLLYNNMVKKDKKTLGYKTK